MGAQITVDGVTVYPDDYSVGESSTPSVGGDTSGSVGSIGTAFPSNPLQRLWSNKPVTLADTRQGSTLGRAFAVSEDRGTGMTAISAVSRLGDLSIRSLQAQPYSGTLGGAFAYYLGLAGITSGYVIQGGIETRPVAFPGWYGELWTNLKELCAVQQVEVALVSRNIVLRPLGSRIARNDRSVDQTISVDAQQLAQTVQAYCYYSTAITNQIVYPTPEDPQIIQVNAGETSTTTIQLAASLSAIEQPTAKLFVPQGGTGTSEYTIIGNDNLPVSPAAWSAFGGSLTITVNQDTTSVDIVAVGAVGLPNADGSAITSFRFALSDDDNTYNTLYFRGTGVKTNKTLYTFRTGVTAAQTSQEIGLVVDNRYVSTLQEVYRIGTSAARQYTGRKIGLSGSVTAINRRGDTGSVNYPTYDYVDTVLLASLTYNGVQADPRFSGKSYDQVQAYLFTLVQDSFENQVFGNVGGARIWDEPSRRWFRIREATITPGGISIGQAEDDLKNADMQTLYTGDTYNSVKTVFATYTYDESNLLGALSA